MTTSSHETCLRLTYLRWMASGMGFPAAIGLRCGAVHPATRAHPDQAHVKLGKPTILCRVRKATPRDLKLHMM